MNPEKGQSAGIRRSTTPLLRSELCDSHREETASLLTHAAGAMLAVPALVLLLWQAADDGARAIVSATLFGSSLIALYASSSLYHFFTSPRWKARFQRIDHICIFLLIAGSYTPFTLLTLRGPWGWSLFGTIWGLALAGIGLKLLSRGRQDHWASTALYLAMGWLVLVAVVPLLRALPSAGFAWLVAGGLCYSLGVIFFQWRKLPYHHAVWHLFVLAGSACHVAAVAFHVF